MCVCACARAQLSGLALPDWGFQQREVVAEKHLKASADGLDWTVEEHRYGTSEEQREREAELHSPTHAPVDRNVSFWARFVELQVCVGHVMMGSTRCAELRCVCSSSGRC